MGWRNRRVPDTMGTIVKGFFRKLARVFGIIVGSLVGLVLILAVVNLSITAMERHCFPAPGRFVEVGGRRMHIFTVGSGTRNVVLLSGLGTASPVTDFAPLINALKPDFTVTVVECFGYGWSDWTDQPRTNQKVVEEVRLALREAGVLPPYIVVPHSLSGIYTLYWTNIHPEEVSAVVALDMTVPAQLKYIHPTGVYTLVGVARAVGVVRLALLLDPGLAGYNVPAYSEEQRQTVRRMASWNYLNKTVRNETYWASSNLREVQDDKFPDSIPTSMILSKDSVQQLGKFMPGMDWVKAHQDLVAGNSKAKIYLVDGGHNVHWLNSEMIADVLRETVGR
jgi:pimeloyl-ACP methyl ester carboxylesterase